VGVPVVDGGNVLVIQSHRQPLPGRWLEVCLQSVRAWAASRGYAYRFEDDALFRHLDPDLRRRTAAQLPIAADLARLAALEQALAEGWGAVVWIDADTLVLDPHRLDLPAAAYALGREVWVQRDRSGLRVFVKVHNAFLLFRRGNPFLAFYRHAAETLVRRHQGPMAPQFIGPKLLTALHNLVGCPVAERAGMLSPAVAHDVLSGGGAALDLFRRHSVETPAAVNLCGSLVGREIDEAVLLDVMGLLMERQAVLAG
jgi:hypothetical protein